MSSAVAADRSVLAPQRANPRPNLLDSQPKWIAKVSRTPSANLTARILRASRFLPNRQESGRYRQSSFQEDNSLYSNRSHIFGDLTSPNSRCRKYQQNKFFRLKSCPCNKYNDTTHHNAENYIAASVNPAATNAVFKSLGAINPADFKNKTRSQANLVSSTGI
jgi:hypothetical protein